jgi:alcohol dehydrogenase class IV
MLNFDFNATRSIAVQRGGTRQLAARLKAMGCRRVLLVTDAGVIAANLLQRPVAALRAGGIEVAVFGEVVADPPESVIMQAVAAALAHDADSVVGLGGGSSMDAAKLAALLACSREPLDSVYGVNQAKGPRLPLVLIPTTAGTGSEVTPISIVTTGESEKKGVVSPLLLPDLALLDAELTLGLPAHVTAATGIDAMVHAIEAYTSKRLKNPLSDCLAREALRLLSRSLHRACQQGSDIAARENMLLGACLAGMAFANAPVGAVHALAYPVGARFHVPHGLSNALMLASVIRFNAVETAGLYAELCDVVLPGTQGSEKGKADTFATYLASLAPELGLACRLRDVGIQATDLALLAEDAMKQTRLLINNPRALTQTDALALYQEAL